MLSVSDKADSINEHT